MEQNYLYMFECDYASRTREKKFLKDILNNFDKDYATMVGVVVNNNPYCLAFHIAVNLQKDPIVFELWLKDNYPGKLKRYNIFTKDIPQYNVQTFIDADMVDFAITLEGGGYFFGLSESYLKNNIHNIKILMKSNPRCLLVIPQKISLILSIH